MFHVFQLMLLFLLGILHMAPMPESDHAVDGTHSMLVLHELAFLRWG
jgi:hypothetical protein